ncbi:AbrB family transcriptional regulator [candidate division WWE3 bacterium CG10_big_fil_rev_8_21_14_0_10_32_10]|uniref:AbrB family transcriptional regulator n=1 Tax=candidate division WWE3 bacterium CG10_big_fil_rev_8_21_14_0_10_32_10 TaxID=1975090 RepID=A0A2H0RBP0_UNCKA|nr:MAG: AbrB family transcriptional regulator [candidate division WWE3 bacterium CG10_big_fil_rev_8_21_14_0_10_32_10]
MKEFTTTVTQKGQVTIPKKMRDALGIEKYGMVKVIKKRNYIKLKPITDIVEMAGFLDKYIKKNKGVDPLKAREYMETHYKRV